MKAPKNLLRLFRRDRLGSVPCPFETVVEIRPMSNAPAIFEEPVNPLVEPNRWENLVERIRMGDPSGLDDLYRHFSTGVRFFLSRQLGTREIDDRVHDTFLIVVDAIRSGDLRSADRLMGYIRTVVRRKAAAVINETIHERRDEVEVDPDCPLADERLNAEETMIREQQAAIMKEMLEDVPERDREILTRFYLYEETQEEICERMGLSANQFRLLKSRAKARFEKMTQGRFRREK